MIGNNLVLQITQNPPGPDDEVGGFTFASGTVSRLVVNGRVEAVPSIERLGLPGYETNRQYDVMLPPFVNIFEGNYLLVLNSDHPEYGKPMRVVTTSRDSLFDGRGHWEVRVVVEERATRSTP